MRHDAQREYMQCHHALTTEQDYIIKLIFCVP